MRNNTGKWLIVIFITAWAIYSFYPPQGRDLIQQFSEMGTSKDTNFTAIVERAKKETSPNLYQNLRVAIGTNDISK